MVLLLLSVQDTLVALDALRRFAERTFTTNINKDVTVTIDGSSVTHTITSENRYQRRDFQVSLGQETQMLVHVCHSV